MNKTTQTLLAAVALLTPVTTGAVAFDVMDTVAGLATEVVISELHPGSQVELRVQSPIGDAFKHTLNASDHGIAHTWVAGTDLEVAGTYKLEVEDALGTRTTGALTVHPDSVDHVRSYVEMATTQIDVGEEVIATVVLMDRFGNALAGRSAELISSRPEDLVQAIARETDQYGEQQFLVRASSPGEISLRAIDLISGEALKNVTQVAAGNTFDAVGGPEQVAYSAPVGRQQFYRGNPYSANLLNNPSPYRAQFSDPPRFDHIQITIIGKEGEPVPALEQYKAESMLLTALDQYGNPYFDYTGTVYLATTDPEATQPSLRVYNFAFEDEGQNMLTHGLKFSASGPHTMVLTERPDEIPSDLNLALGFLDVAVSPKQVVITPAQQIQITAPEDGVTLNTTDIVVEGRGPPFINIAVSGGVEEIESETDRQGNYSVAIALDSSKEEHTVTVKDVNAAQNMAERSFRIDVTPPEIAKITFTPDNPIEGTDVLVVVESEPNLAAISLEFNGQVIDMATNDPGAGKYQALVSVPVAGSFDAVVTASDAQGNSAQSTGTLGVALRGLPQVQNVIAEAQINAIALRWDPITDDDIDAYRIYVGTEPGEFAYTLDTDRPTAAATVAGLRPGTTYHFGVTALEEERESEEKSDVVSATVLGVKLDVTPGDGSLFIEWNSLQQDIPLSNFLLEYGVEPEVFTEKRSLNGELRAFTLRDLINGINYHLRLTPIATTGESLEDLAATGQGTPIGAGFTAGSSDPVPFDLRAAAPSGVGTQPPPPPLMKKVPLSKEGVPMWMLFTILGISGGMFHMYLRRKKTQQSTIAFAQRMDSIYRR